MSHPFPQKVDNVVDGYKLANAERIPVFVPVNLFADDRGWSIMNQFQGVMAPEGQVNFSSQYPGTIKAWHRHQKQTDFWLCVQGHLKAGIYREQDGMTWSAVFGERCPGVVIVPPPLWHGASTIGPTTAGLLYYVTHAYNPSEPDEERRAFDSVPNFDWAPEHK